MTSADTSSSVSALHILLSPDGYYTYLKIPRNDKKKVSMASSLMGGKEEDTDKEDEIDNELVKKNYRRLSLRHHPDRRGGDAETFRVLTRAKRVLTTPKLRKEYDLLGLDLDDDEENEDHQEGAADDNSKKDKSNNQDKNGDSGGSTTPETVMSHLASATLASILQAVVRTAMMGLASTLICRHKILMIPGILFLCFISYRTMKAAQNTNPPGTIGTYEKIAPLGISLGLYFMHIGRDYPDKPWSWTFWIGETAVMTFFFLNSVPKYSGALAVAFSLGSFILTLILRGKFWRYTIVIFVEAGLAFIAVLAFPIMEMIFEEIMNDKLRKIGDKIRAQSKQVETLYNQQQQKMNGEKDLD